MDWNSRRTAGSFSAAGRGMRWCIRLNSRRAAWQTTTEIELSNPSLRAVRPGLAVNAAGTRLFVANVWANHVSAWIFCLR